jgi:predicted RNA-binding Zn-ribbon protein involved in translation (DUF1610 family)
MPFLKSFKDGKNFKHEKLGNTKSICPYCNQVLVKRPKRKKKCPHCGNYIFVRTRPADNKKVLVTEEQASIIDIQWMKENGTYEAYLEKQAEFQTTKAKLTKRFGHEASDYDVQWAIYNEQLIEHSQAMNWGLYRNTRFDMAELLRKEGRNIPAIATYIEVSYLDANGPRNVGGVFDPQLLQEFPPFDENLAFQAPGIIRLIEKLSVILKLSDQELESKYLEIANQVQERMQLPVSPSEAWREYKKSLNNL